MLEERNWVLTRLIQKQDDVKQEFKLFGKSTVVKILDRAGKNAPKNLATLQLSDHALNGHHPEVPGPVALIEKAIEVHKAVEETAVSNLESNLKVYWQKENCILIFFCYKVAKKVFTALTTAYVPDKDKECDITV